MATYITLENLATFLAQCKLLFVEQESGKVLSSNDFTDALLEKLNGIATGAEVNVIDSVEVNGTPLSVTDKAVNIDLSNYALKTDIATAMYIRGSVTSYSDLPASPSTGDCYVIETADASNDIEAGELVVWNGSEWIDVGGVVDLSGYVTQTALTESLSAYVLSANLDTLVATLGYIKANEVSGEIDLSGYLTITSAQETYQPIGDYVTTTSLASTLAEYVTTSAMQTAIETALADYVTSTGLTTILADYVTSTSLTSTLADYVTSSALSTELASYVTSSALSSTLGDYVLSSEIEQATTSDIEGLFA